MTLHSYGGNVRAMTKGEIVYRPEQEHRCGPPFRTEQFSTSRTVQELDRFVVGTIWRCAECGAHWYVKGSGGYSTGAGRSWYLKWRTASKRRLRKAGIEV